MRRNLRSNCVKESQSRARPVKNDFSIEKYGEKTAEREECEEQLLAEYAAMLAFYLASVVTLTSIATEQDRLPRSKQLEKEDKRVREMRTAVRSLSRTKTMTRTI